MNSLEPREVWHDESFIWLEEFPTQDAFQARLLLLELVDSLVDSLVGRIFRQAIP